MPDYTTRCKFTCVSVTKVQNWQANKGDHPFLYSYEFQVVTGNSEENKKFFASTPTGTLKFGTIHDDLFEPGKSYYLDLSPAE